MILWPTPAIPEQESSHLVFPERSFKDPSKILMEINVEAAALKRKRK